MTLRLSRRAAFLAAVTFFAVIISGSGQIAGASTGQPLSWSLLPDPAVQEFVDPYQDLTVRDIQRLRDYDEATRTLSQLASESDQAMNLRTRLDALRSEFAAMGLDPDWLIDQRWVVAGLRETAATQGNPGLDGRSVTLEGFAIAAPPEADGTPTVYLVELRGLCSHMPPPNANQMIRVRLNTDWRPRYMHHPVRLSGALYLDQTTQVMRIVDGPVAMQAAWRMEAQTAEAYFPRPPEDWQSSEWAKRMRSLHDAPAAETGQ